MKLASNKFDLETGAYFIIWIGVVLYAVYNVKKTSDGIFTDYNADEFTTGWKILDGRKKDVSDFDWEIVTYIIRQQFIWLCIHLIVSEILKQIGYYKLLPFAQIAVTVLYVLYNFNVSMLVLLLLQPFLFEILSKFKRELLIWQFQALCFVFLHFYKQCYYKKCIPFFDTYISHNHHTLMMLSLYWTNLRCVSYTMSKIDKTIRKVGFITVLSYCLYLPLLSLGPFVDIHDFVKIYTRSKVTFSRRLITSCINISRFIFWWIIIDFLLHFIYSPYLSYYPMYVDRLDSWTLCGFGYCMGQYFHMKYVVSYGISTTLAKFENIAAPNTPKCIARIHLYSDMWRYFDHGLYVFLRSYIYVPLKKVKFPSYLASFFSFCFVYIWHGWSKDIMVWALLNYVCVTIESAFKHYYNKYIRKWCERTFNYNWRQRFACMLAAPLLALSAISNFYFFAGMDVGNIFFRKFLEGNTQRLCTVLFSLYCCSQISSYIKKREELNYLATKLK